MNNNILVVESVNDKYFVEELIRRMNFEKPNLLEPVCKIDDYECMGGINQLEFKLTEISRDIKKRGLSKIGILFDANSVGVEKRTAEINKIIKQVFPTGCDAEIVIYILNLDGKGELETILRTIKTKPSIYADCLDNWRKCLSNGAIEVSNKEFDKFWVQIYQRYDCCNNQEKKQAGKKCSNEASMKKEIWDFDHKVLLDLRNFLKTFKKEKHVQK